MKKLIGFLIVFCLLMPLHVLGHSYVGSSTPSEGEVVNEPLKEIVLQFDAGIEEHTSIDLADEDGVNIPIRNQYVEERTLVALLNELIYSGQYTIQWTALGSDGHTTEGTISFTVDAPEPEVVEEEIPEVDVEVPQVNEEVLEEESVEEEQIETEEIVEEETEEAANFILFILLGIVVVIGAIVLVRRRK
ncbi:copper resistance CopC family protein [Alkalihalobacterium elongatum]|uniref:copper resistance CopC family protein n=1 Tax=Alkalihalobacterium elongatum TaxID=2675466 RepID=UPI001C1F3EFC|nr:copper resistance CopC family protein [Alkalihalobacterium elongatum]